MLADPVQHDVTNGRSLSRDGKGHDQTDHREDHFMPRSRVIMRITPGSNIHILLKGVRVLCFDAGL